MVQNEPPFDFQFVESVTPHSEQKRKIMYAAEKVRKSVKVFISYAHADQELHKKLEEHLSPLKRLEKITIWQDQEIPAGADWQDQIHTCLNEADLILLLVSASFINSDYCWNQEVRTALQRHQTGKAQVIPIILRPTFWQDTPLGLLQALPTEGKPVVLWNDQDIAFEDVVRGVQKVVKDLLRTLRGEAQHLALHSFLPDPPREVLSASPRKPCLMLAQPKRWRVALVLIFSILVLIGAASTAKRDLSPRQPTSPTNATSSATVVTRTTPGAVVTRTTPGAGGASPTSSTVTNGSGGPVTVQVSALTYHSNETIVVTVSNPSAHTIVFADHQTNCTTVLLQRQSDTSWDPVALCKAMTATRLLELVSGGSMTIPLKPFSLWTSGTYRVVFGFHYKLDNSWGLGPSTILYSSSFQVD